jgi:hypothetical protein
LIHNYLEAVDSVARRLFEARADYHEIINDLFKDSIPPIFVHNRNNPEEVIARDHAAWLEQKHIKIKKEKSDAAIENITNEQFALSIIDGSLLQIACKGIELYSDNTHNTSPLPNLSDKACKFSVGEKIRGIPAGLIIYAGRNHYNHLEDGKRLRKPTKEIVSLLNVNYLQYKPNILFDFDSYNELPRNLTTSFISILGWDNAKDFRETLMSINEI